MQGAGCGKAARPVLRGVSPVRDLPTYQIAPYEIKTLCARMHVETSGAAKCPSPSRLRGRGVDVGLPTLFWSNIFIDVVIFKRN